jgi:hypothetical protein
MRIQAHHFKNCWRMAEVEEGAVIVRLVFSLLRCVSSGAEASPFFCFNQESEQAAKRQGLELENPTGVKPDIDFGRFRRPFARDGSWARGIDELQCVRGD